MDELLRLSNVAVYNESYPYKDQVMALYKGLPDAWKHSAIGKEVNVLLFPPQVVELGSVLADGDLYDLQGDVHRLAEFKGKYILLDFWFDGCAPCRLSLPELRELHNLYGDRLVMVSVSIDAKAKWERASKQHGIVWWNLNDLQGRNGLYARYGVRGVPHYAIISPEGKVLEQWEGYQKGALKLQVEAQIDK